MDQEFRNTNSNSNRHRRTQTNPKLDADGDERVMAAAQQILKSLGTSNKVTQDMIQILSNFDKRLSSGLGVGGGLGDGLGLGLVVKSEVEEEFEAAEKIVRKWDENGGNGPRYLSLPWEENPDEAGEYLSAVDEIIRLTEEMTVEEGGERAESVLQMAMAKLEEEFRLILIKNTIPLDAGRLYGSIQREEMSLSRRGSEDAEGGGGGVIQDYESSIDSESVSFHHDRGASLGDELCGVDLIHPDAVVDLREIADRMIRSGYEKECCQVYSSVRKDVLDECLTILGIEKLSIEEVQKVDWKLLDDMMRKWCQAVKISVRVLLSGEKKLCDLVFGEAELIKEVCFSETAKGCVRQLLNFGDAIAIGRRSSEKLFRILDMYDALTVVIPDLQVLLPDASGDNVCSEAKGILTALGEAVKGTLVEFESAVQKETSKKPIQGGEIHPMTRYVMNYVRLLADYSNSLNLLLECETDTPSRIEGDDDADDTLQLGSLSPIGCRLLGLLSILESNLDEKSKLYDCGAMQYIFWMNNILYIVQKVKDSELGKLLGNHWVRKRRSKVRQYATSYLRASWTKVLSFLKDDGIGGSGSVTSVSKVALKERFKNFNLGFEEIYRTQTAWKVHDPQLREELRISISEKVLPAYRFFMGRFGSHLESGRHAKKYIKYTPDDLENYLLDLFEGVPKVLNNLRRKPSN